MAVCALNHQPSLRYQKYIHLLIYVSVCMCARAMEHGTEIRGLVLGIASPLPAHRSWGLNHVIRFWGASIFTC